jgi:adenosylmethionine-8-amino-7-oxononanoate aminotransferase
VIGGTRRITDPFAGDGTTLHDSPPAKVFSTTAGLLKLKEKYKDWVGDTRGRGLLQGLELVSKPGAETARPNFDRGYRVRQSQAFYFQRLRSRDRSDALYSSS